MTQQPPRRSVWLVSHHYSDGSGNLPRPLTLTESEDAAQGIKKIMEAAHCYDIHIQEVPFWPEVRDST